MKEYKDLVGRILSNGEEYSDRTGKGTLAIFGETLTVDLADGFPIVTARRIDFSQAAGELATFLKGQTKKSEFRANGCNYWDRFGRPDIDDLGPIYGKQWVDWECPPFGKDKKTWLNQIAVLVAMIKNDPTSRRLILQTWNPGEINEMVLPPCHISTQYNVHKGKLDSIVAMRSCDIMLGLPYDMVVYALLQHILAYQCGLKVGTMRFDLHNAHIYLPHVMDAIRFEKLEVFKSPNLVMAEGTSVWNFEPDMVWLSNYNHGPAMKFELFV
jgi:thymidylate synthase